MSSAESADSAEVEAERVWLERGAEVIYTQYRVHCEFVEGKEMPPWSELCERKKHRWRSAAAGARTWLRLREASR